MKTKTYQTGLLSVAIAVVLWLAATWFDDDARWLPAERRDMANPAHQVPRDDTPLRVNTDRMSCQQAEAELARKVKDAQYCTNDDECTLFDYGYPIQCLTSVAKSEITALRVEYRQYEESCAYRVYYDCPSGEMQRQAVCRQNHCAVDLVGTDPLKDETLRYLGIQGE